MRVSIRLIRSHTYTNIRIYMRARAYTARVYTARVAHVFIVTPSLRIRSRKQIHAYASRTANVKNQDIDVARVCMCTYVHTYAGILDREHLLMPPQPPASQASSKAHNGISEVFRRDHVSC